MSSSTMKNGPSWRWSLRRKETIGSDCTGNKTYGMKKKNIKELHLSLIVLYTSEIMQDFSVEGSTKCLGDPILEVRNKILLLGKAQKFGVIFQKYALKLIKIWENYWDNSRKMQLFLEFFFIFLERTMGKIRI